MKRTLDERRYITEYYEEHGIKKTMQHYSLTKCQVKEIARWYRKNRLKRREQFTDERIAKVRKSALAFCFKKSHSVEFAEDFSSFVMIKIMEGRKIELDNLYKDFIKSIYGEKNSERNEANRNTHSIEDTLIDPSDYETHEFRLQFDQRLRAMNLDTRETAIMKLRFKYDLMSTEIADVFGVDKARITQLFNRILAKVKIE